MSRKHYIQLARIAGETLATARHFGGEETRTAVYEAMYEPLTAMLRADNPNFSQVRFAYATGLAETAYAERMTTNV